MSETRRIAGAPIGAAQEAGPANQGTEGADLTQALIDRDTWTDAEVAASGIPMEDVDLVSVGGGLGSFALADTLRIAGLGTGQIRVLGDNSSPTATYEYLAANSQIPEHERLRSDAGSVMDNIWGFPSYALREAWTDKSLKAVWQVVTEPILAEYYTPRAGQVYASVRREAARIGWEDMLRLGFVRMIRKREGGGYFVVHTPQGGSGGAKRHIYRTNFAHIAVGYPGVAFLPDLQEYRERTGDYSRVVNAYEPHDHVYAETRTRPCTIVVRGSGIVASRVLQRLLDDYESGAQIRVIHLFRNYVDGPQGDDPKFKRPGRNGFAYQAFNFPKSAWGGQLRYALEELEGDARSELLDKMGGTNTAPRKSWSDQLERARKAGAYDQAVGKVVSVEAMDDGSAIRTRVATSAGDEHVIDAQFIIDATGLLARIEEHRLMADLLDHSGVGKNPKGRLDVERHFEVRGAASGPGRLYASGSMTLGGYYAGVDSFLGLQYAAQRIADNLAEQGLGKKLGTGRSVQQWVRWARNKTP